MHRLFGANPPAGRFREYHAQVTAMIWDLTGKAVRSNRDVILDFGFWTKQSRDDARVRAASLGARVRLYSVICDEHTILSRLRERSRSLDVESLPIDEHGFRAVAATCEPPGPEEQAMSVETTDDGYRVLE